MSDRPLSRFTAGPGQQAPAMGFREEAKGFKPPSEGRQMVRAVAPDSVEWQELHMSRRLEIAPFLETLIRGGRAKLVYTEEFTSTCEEKAAAAGIPVEATVKAVFCKDMFSPDDLFVIVASGKGRISLGGILSEVHEYAQLEMAKAEDLPGGMEFGTCTPFVSPAILERLTLVAIESPKTELKRKGRTVAVLGDLEADFSIGGTDSTSHHLSVRMRYADFVDALRTEYGDKAAVIEGIKRN